MNNVGLRNDVLLRGPIRYIKISEVANGSLMTRAKINDIKIVGFGPMAEKLSAITEGTVVEVRGIIQERSYNGTCKKCGAPHKQFWTDVSIYECTI